MIKFVSLTTNGYAMLKALFSSAVLIFMMNVVFAQGVVLSYDTLNDAQADFSGYKSKIPVNKFITRFGSTIEAKSKLVVGVPILSSGVFVSFLNGKVPSEKILADGHKPFDAGLSGNFMVINEMVSWNPALDERMQTASAVAEAISTGSENQPTDEEVLKLHQYPLLIVAYATLSNGAEITITDLARALESGELVDPSVPVITSDIQLQLDKIDLLLQRGDISKVRHKELQTEILRKAAGK